jgi:hypothetical protein
MEGGHAKCFGVGVLEIIEASEGIVGETRGRSVNEVGTLGVLKNLLEWAFHCGCGLWSEGRVVVKMSTNK